MAAVLQKKLLDIHDILLRTYGPQKCCLDHTTPFQLLVATILSAQCTDKKVNTVTPALFARYPDAKAFAAAELEDVEKMVHVCGFYHAKAKNILGAAKIIAEQYKGEVPADMDLLTQLPGVGRKTANVVLGDAYHVPGLPVDTHVKRLTNLMGLVKTDSPEEIESILCANLPPKLWAEFSHLVIIHGRNRCPARRPDCEACEIAALCAHGRKTKKNRKD